MADLKNQLEQKATGQVKQANKKQGMESMLNMMSEEIKKALPENIKSERFQRIALTAFNGNPELQQCEPISFIAAMMQSAQLGLEPNTPLGQAYLIPYGTQVQFQVGYKGLLDLAHRTGMYKNIQAQTVYENDEFDMELGLNPVLRHKPLTNGERGAVIGYYAVYNLINGGQGFEYMTIDDVKQHKNKYSKAKFSPWVNNFDEMAKKTVLKKVLKYAPMSTELQHTTSIDERIIDDSKVKENKSDEKFIDVEWSYVEERVDEETGEIIG